MTVAPDTARLRRLDLAAVAAGDPGALADRDALIRRGATPDPTVREAVRRTLADVRERGGAAVRDASHRVGGGRPDGAMLIDPAEMRAATEALPPAVRRAVDQAVAHVWRFAESQLPRTLRVVTAPGIELERRWTPLASVGAYVPGGSAAYPSTLIMTVVPAKVAGVGRVVVASPADRDGAIDPVLLGVAGLLD